jgi:hypothetical protein
MGRDLEVNFDFYTIRGKTISAIWITRNTDSSEKVKELIIEQEVKGFHEDMLETLPDWAGLQSLEERLTRSKNKIQELKEFGTIEGTTVTTKVKSEVYSTHLSFIDDTIRSKLNSWGIKTADLGLRAINISKMKPDSLEGELGKYTKLLEQLGVAAFNFNCDLGLPDWYDRELYQERVKFGSKESWTETKTWVSNRVKWFVTRLVSRVELISELVEGLKDEPHSMEISCNGDVEVKLNYKSDNFDPLKEGIKRDLGFKWDADSKVWSGTLNDIGRAVDEGFTLKTLLTCIKEDKDLKRRLDKQFDILLGLLDKAELTLDA